MPTLNDILEGFKSELLGQLDSHKDQVATVVADGKQAAASVLESAQQEIADLKDRLAKIEAFIGTPAQPAPQPAQQPEPATIDPATGLPVQQ